MGAYVAIASVFELSRNQWLLLQMIDFRHKCHSLGTDAFVGLRGLEDVSTYVQKITMRAWLQVYFSILVGYFVDLAIR